MRNRMILVHDTQDIENGYSMTLLVREGYKVMCCYLNNNVDGVYLPGNVSDVRSVHWISLDKELKTTFLFSYPFPYFSYF